MSAEAVAAALADVGAASALDLEDAVGPGACAGLVELMWQGRVRGLMLHGRWCYVACEPPPPGEHRRGMRPVVRGTG